MSCCVFEEPPYNIKDARGAITQDEVSKKYFRLKIFPTRNWHSLTVAGGKATLLRELGRDCQNIFNFQQKFCINFYNFLMFLGCSLFSGILNISRHLRL